LFLSVGALQGRGENHQTVLKEKDYGKIRYWIPVCCYKKMKSWRCTCYRIWD